MPAKTSLPLLTLTSAPPDAHAVLARAKQQIGMVPNMYGYMAHVPGLLETYLSGYDSLRHDPGFTSAELEVVFLAISRENECDYCMAAHSVLADTQSGVDRAVTDAIRDGDAIPDARLAALAEFTRTMVYTRGRPAATDLDDFLSAGYTERHVFAIILAIGVKTLSNYSNHFAATPVDSFFKSRAWVPPRARPKMGV